MKRIHPSTGQVGNDDDLLPQQQQQPTSNKSRRRVESATSSSPPRNTEQTTSDETCIRIVAEPRKRKKSLYGCESVILEELLYPYKVDDFLKDSFRQQAVHIQWNNNHKNQKNKKKKKNKESSSISPSSSTTKATTKETATTTIPERFPNVPILQNIMDDPDLVSLVRETSSESIFVWLSKPTPQALAKPSSSASIINDHTLDSTTTTSSSSILPSSSSASPSPIPPALIQSIEISDPETAMKLHDISGHALYFRAPPYIEQPLVAALLRSTGLGCSHSHSSSNNSISTGNSLSLGRGEVEVFVGGHYNYPAKNRRNPNIESPPAIPISSNQINPNFVTGWHYDFQENFTIQISGMKRWTLHPGIVQHPLRACTPHYDIATSTTTTNDTSVMESQVLASRLAHDTLLSPTSMISTHTTTNSCTKTSSSSVEVVDMYPGDVLYFPAGMWHTVETIESGISMNISLMGSNYATITCQALQHFLLRNEEWRQCIQNHPRNSGSAVEHLQQLIQSLPSLLQKAVDNHEWSARMILPPVLYEPVTDKNESQDNENDNDDEHDDEDNDDDNNETDDVIDVRNIVLPDIRFDGIPVFHKWPLDTHQLCKNPLAILLHEEREIRNCYINFQPFQSDHHYFPARDDITCNTTSSDSIYVLNVNFAGNESHESMIRYRLLLNDAVVETIQRYVQNKKDTIWNGHTDDVPEVTKHHVNCLVYYGYLTWEKKN